MLTLIYLLFFGGLGFFAFLFVMPLIPGSIDSLLIDPNRNKPDGWEQDKTLAYPKSRRGFFTKLYPGQVKIKETWNGNFVAMLMNWQGKHFIGERPDNPYTTEHQEYWEVVDSGDLPDSHPLPATLWPWRPQIVGATEITMRNRIVESLTLPLRLLWWAWTSWVYWLTGGVWVGIPGFRTVRIYQLTRYKKVIRADGEIDLERVTDWSDHYRVAHFQSPIKVPAADTQNLVEVEILLNQINFVTNPYLVAYNTDDDWMPRLIGANIDAATRYTRPLPHTQVLVAADSTAAAAMATFITNEVRGRLEVIGLDAFETQILDISPTNEELQRELAEPARAQARLDAAVLDARAKAEPVVRIGEALRNYPEAQHIPGLEARIRTAEAAGDKAIIVMGGDSDDVKPLDAASLRALRELNARLSPPAATPPAGPAGGTP